MTNNIYADIIENPSLCHLKLSFFLFFFIRSFFSYKEITDTQEGEKKKKRWEMRNVIFWYLSHHHELPVTGLNF